MEITLEELKKLNDNLDKFDKDKNLDIQKIHLDKTAIQEIKTEVLNSLKENGYYLRDDNKIIISAPEIIIGNVDKNGVLMGNAPTTVTIRANQIKNEGVSIGSSNGRICSKAPIIQQIAVNPGVDGIENLVETQSMIISKARGITIETEKTIEKTKAEDEPGFFLTNGAASTEGILLNTDSQIQFNALDSANSRELNNNNHENDDAKITELKTAIRTSLQDLEMSIKKNAPRHNHHINIRLNQAHIDAANMKMTKVAADIYDKMLQLYDLIAKSAESKRLTKQKNERKKKLDHEAQKTTTSIGLVSELVTIETKNGDNERDTKDKGGISIVSKNLKFQSLDDKGDIMKNSNVSLLTDNVIIDTSKRTYNDKKLKSTKADGKVEIISKDIQLKSIDTEADGNNDKNKMKESALAQGGSFTVRTEKTSFDATETNGDATGSFKANAKKITLRTVDVNKDNRKPEKVAKGSKVTLASDVIYVGSTKDKYRSETVQVYGTNANLIAEDYVQVSQKQAYFLATGNKVSIAGDPTLYTNIKFEGKVIVSQTIDAASIKADDVTVKSLFNAVNSTLKAGMMAPPPKPPKQAKKPKDPENGDDANTSDAT